MKCQSSRKNRGQRRCEVEVELKDSQWNGIQKQPALTSTLSHPHHSTNQKHSSRKYQPAGTVCIKDRSNLHATEKGEESVEAEDPAHGAGRRMSQLVRAEVRLKRSSAVEDAKAGRHAAEGSQDDQPSAQTTFGKSVSVILVLLLSLFAICGPIGGNQRGRIRNLEG